MESYIEMKKRHQMEFNAFPIAFAFDEEQFEEGMRELGLDPSETDKVYQLSGSVGFYRKCDATALRDMFDRHEQEHQEAIAADKTGDGYIFEMFDYELGNYEYGYSGDTSATLEALCLTYKEVASDPHLLHGFEKACKHQMELYNACN